MPTTTRATTTTTTKKGNKQRKICLIFKFIGAQDHQDWGSKHPVKNTKREKRKPRDRTGASGMWA